MPRWTRNDDAWDDELASDDGLEDADWSDEDGDEPTEPCPYCGREIHEETLRCPYCENYLSAEDTPPPQKPWWLVLGAVAGLYAVYRWIAWYNGPGP
jgi:hypothetical protein